MCGKIVKNKIKEDKPLTRQELRVASTTQKLEPEKAQGPDHITGKCVKELSNVRL